MVFMWRWFMGWSGGGECGVREWFLMCFEWEIEW